MFLYITQVQNTIQSKNSNFVHVRAKQPYAATDVTVTYSTEGFIVQFSNPPQIFFLYFINKLVHGQSTNLQSDRVCVRSVVMENLEVVCQCLTECAGHKVTHLFDMVSYRLVFSLNNHVL